MEPARQRQFRIHHCLGRGGFGEVYRATMLSSGGIRADVALKLLRLDVEPGGEAARRLRDEGRLLSTLRHPAILTVHDMALLEGRVGLVTEFVEGQDLSALVQGRPLPARVLMEAIGRVAEALDVAWGAASAEGRPLHLIHRDVKPSNIRIGRHGEVKLLDFGIARSVTDGVDREARTGTGSAVGSLAYMAPERFSRAPAGPAADVFGLGCSLFEGLCGARLFPDVVPVEMFHLAADPGAHAHHVARALEGIDASPAIIGLLGRMLLHDPTSRPTAAVVAATCEGLAEAIAGDSLRRWARSRTWPDPKVVPGHFDGRTITEGTLSTQPLTEAGPATSETYNFDLPNPALAPSRRRPWVLALGLGFVAMLVLPWGRPADRTPTMSPPEYIDPFPGPDLVPVLPYPAPGFLDPDPVGVPLADPPILEPEPGSDTKPAGPSEDATVETIPDDILVLEPGPPLEFVVAKGHVQVATAGVEIELRAGGVVYGPGPVPIGRYDLYADFRYGMQHQGRYVDVVEGRPLTIECNTLLHQCQAQD